MNLSDFKVGQIWRYDSRTYSDVYAIYEIAAIYPNPEHSLGLIEMLHSRLPEPGRRFWYPLSMMVDKEWSLVT